MPGLDPVVFLSPSSIGTAIEVTVASLASPTELNSRAASQGDLVITRTVAAGTDDCVIYYADTTSDAEALPYIVSSSTSGVKFVAIAGRYRNGTEAIAALTASRVVTTDASKNLDTPATVTTGQAWAFTSTLTVVDGNLTITGSSDATKALKFEVDAQTANDTLTINTGAQTDSRTATFPVLTGNSILTLSNATLTSGRVPYVTTNGILTDSAGLTYNGTTTFTVGPSASVGVVQAGADNATASQLVANGANNTQRLFRFRTASVDRWTYAVQDNETGSNAGSNYYINAYADGGTLIDTPVTIVRVAGGAMTLTRPTSFTSTTDSTSKDTGSIVTEGGIGVEKAVVIGTSLTVNGLTSTRIPYLSTSGLFVDSAGLTYSPSGSYTITVGDGSTAQDSYNIMRSPAGQIRAFLFRTGSNNRWLFGANNNAESGSDAGSSFILSAYTDAGGGIDTPLTIVRASGGLATLTRPLTQTSATDATSSSTGAFQTSGGANIAKNLLARQGSGKGLTSTATAAGTTTLTNASTQVQIFTGTTTQTLQLPAANLFGSGIAVEYIVINRSTGTVTAQRAGSDTFDGGGTTDAILTNTTRHYLSNGSNQWHTIA